MNLFTWLDVHNATVTAAATIVLTMLTAYYAWQTRQTVTVMRRQQQMDEEERYSAHRPLVHPVRWHNPQDADDLLGDVVVHAPAQDGRPSPGEFRWGEAGISMLIANVGRGIALDLCAVIIPPPNPPPSLSQRYTLWRYALLPADGTASPAGFLGGGSMVPWSSCLVSRDDPTDHVTLQAPPRRSPAERLHSAEPDVIARLTITYRDIVGRKHASIFDFTTDRRWINGRFLPHIAQDLLDLEEGAWAPLAATQPPRRQREDVLATLLSQPDHVS